MSFRPQAGTPVSVCWPREPWLTDMKELKPITFADSKLTWAVTLWRAQSGKRDKI